MFNTEKNRSSYVRANGTEANRRADPDVIKHNKRILRKKIGIRVLAFVFLFLCAIFTLCCLVAKVIDFLYFFLLEALILIFMITCLNSLNRLRQNSCPGCFAISALVHLETRETGRQRTSVTKQVETKHYSSDHKPLAGFESVLSGGPHRYEGKSVTKISVPAIRYDYREIYQCKYCGEIKEVDTYKIVEQ